MKRTRAQLSDHYVTALEKFLNQGDQANLLPALKLGREAVDLGLETLGLARIHEEALVKLRPGSKKRVLAKLAGLFFAEANMAIEATHRAARQNKSDLGRLMATLERRTEQLAASNLQLQKGVVRRRVMENDFAKRGKHHQECLEESLELQTRLRQLTHQVLAAQEDERRKISRELEGEIAQTLLGINVRLLSLKIEARSHSRGLKNTIAKTQRLVAKSARSVRQVGRQIGGV